jgi:hypothetical protein
VGNAVRTVNRVLIGAAAICLSSASAYSQSVELAEVRLLRRAGAPAQSAVFEIDK